MCFFIILASNQTCSVRTVRISIAHTMCLFCTFENKTTDVSPHPGDDRLSLALAMPACLSPWRCPRVSRPGDE
ncbi:hypothetical protein VNO80_06819 [Phaseolus coccineus]|uniref:Uncharacterized protein n=1 Tax=Phaseolus coccineus TaxID=3886 RepID=A0AAN9RJA5_PHACN